MEASLDRGSSGNLRDCITKVYAVLHQHCELFRFLAMLPYEGPCWIENELRFGAGYLISGIGHRIASME